MGGRRDRVEAREEVRLVGGIEEKRRAVGSLEGIYFK